MSEDDKKRPGNTDSPKSRGEQLAEKLAGSNPVEPKPGYTPKVEPKPEGAMDPPAANEPVPPAEPPTRPPVESGPADVTSTKAAEQHAKTGKAVDAPTEPKVDWAAAEKTKQAADKKAAEERAKKAADDKAKADKKAADDKAKADKERAKKAAEKEAEERERANRVPEPPPWYRTLRADPPFYIRMALGLGMVALIFGLWWFLTRGEPHEAIVSPSRLVSPGVTFWSTDKLLERDLLDNTLETLQRVFMGVGLAAIVGIVLGVLAGAHRGVSAALAPVVIFLRSVPMGAMLPLTLLMFGTEEKQKVMFLFLAVVPFVFSDVMKGIASVPDRYVETAQTLGATKRQIVMKVLVPLSLPDIVTSLRFQVGLALGYVMLAEAGQVFVERGLGRMIEVSQRQGPREHVFLLLFVIAAMAFVIDLLLRTLQRGTFPWRKDL